jgi:hypothetical protein
LWTVAEFYWMLWCWVLAPMSDSPVLGELGGVEKTSLTDLLSLILLVGEVCRVVVVQAIWIVEVSEIEEAVIREGCRR